MRTTVRLSEGLLREAKAEAARRGETVTALIERGLRLVLASGSKPAPRTKITLPVSQARGGVRPGINLDKVSEVLDILDGFE